MQGNDMTTKQTTDIQCTVKHLSTRLMPMMLYRIHLHNKLMSLPQFEVTDSHEWTLTHLWLIYLIIKILD